MKQIRAIPKRVFEEHFTNKEFKYYDYACFISILDCDNNTELYDKSIDNFLQVKMWDIEKDAQDTDGTIYEKPSDIELKKIVDFVNKHKDKNVFVIHCTAGISRSGAVAYFIKEKFKEEINPYNFHDDNKHIMPNLYILNRLTKLDTL
jgi:predicted protein tyrosine phosphatase